MSNWSQDSFSDAPMPKPYGAAEEIVPAALTSVDMKPSSSTRDIVCADPSSGNRTPAKRSANGDVAGTSTEDMSGPPKRGAAITASPINVSPLKKFSRKQKGEGPLIETFVFMDFETTGIFPSSINPMSDRERRTDQPFHLTNRLDKWDRATPDNEYPRITEMSFMSIPRSSLENGIRHMCEKSKACDSQTLSLKHRVACNVHTRQIDPLFSEGQWEEYELLRSENPQVIVHQKTDLLKKKPFKEEWPAVRHFLDTCPKPVCLVAHNGLDFDYRILFGELIRCGFTTPDTIPNGVVFVDSLLAFREIEVAHREQLRHSMQFINWSALSANLAPHTIEPIVEEAEGGSHEHEVGTEQAVNENAWLDSRSTATVTPNRPPLPKSTASEPAKSRGRRLFTDRGPVPMEPILHDHPLNFINKTDWTPAKKRRIQPNHFRRVASGHWEMHKENEQQRSSYKLVHLYKTVIGGEYDAHFAQDDSEALLQVAMSYGLEFVKYCDTMAADFPY